MCCAFRTRPKEDFRIPNKTIRGPESELRTQAPPLLLSTGALPASLAGTSECRGCWSPSFDAVRRQSEKAQERSRPLQGHSRQNAPKTIVEPPGHSTRLTPRQIFRALVRLRRNSDIHLDRFPSPFESRPLLVCKTDNASVSGCHASSCIHDTDSQSA
jgi:hypothetical protein